MLLPPYFTLAMAGLIHRMNYNRDDMPYKMLIYTLFFLLLAPELQHVYGQIPQTHAYQVTLRDYLLTFDESDFDVALNPITYSTDFFQSNDELHATWILLENYGRQPTIDITGLRVDSKYFTVEEMERLGQVYMRAGRNSQFLDPINTAWWATWDYEGNPHFNSEAVKRRAFVAAAVDMIMTDQNLEDFASNRRSDYVGGYLTKFAYVYYVVKDMLPEDVQNAYETGLLKFFERIESYYPSGSGGSDLEAFQLAGLWYAAEGIDSDDLRMRALNRAKFVLGEIMQAGGHYHHHGANGIDLSYEGINQHFLSWAALLYNDPEVTGFVNKSAKLKAYQTLPEPTGHFYSPSHFNTGTSSGQANDQWHTYQRDHAMAMLSENARYLIWTGRPLPAWYYQGLPSIEKMQSDIEFVLGARSTDTNVLYSWTIPSENDPGVWRAEHWLNGLPIAAIQYKEGFYQEMLALQSSVDNQTQIPFLREENFIEVIDDAFVIAKFDSYGTIIHTGATVTSWANGVPGLSGGSVSAFWTEKTGSVLLGRSRGTQNADADQWEGETGWETWAVHAISGTNSSGRPFSSARNRQPEVSTLVEGNSKVTVEISGLIGQHDAGRSAPENAIVGDVAYSRTFLVEDTGLSISSSITSDGIDEVSELWEMIPLFLSDTDQGVSDAEISFYSNGTWQTATASLVENVTVLRTTRFDKSIDIIFDQPRSIKLSAEVWTSASVSSRVQNVMVDLLNTDTEAAFMPEYASVSYMIKPTQELLLGDTSGDGTITAFDAASVLQHITDQVLLSDDGSIAADVSGDGTITAFDASLILQYIVGLISCLPADEFCTAS